MCDITIRLGESSHHIIEDINSALDKSIFSDQYKKTLSILENRYRLIADESQKDEDILYNPLNNIISFIGDRGSGKTSCMMSVSKLLDGGLKGKLSEQYPVLSKKSFYRLDLIDPSFFDSEHNVIELFLANLYSKFQEARDRHRYHDDNHADVTKVLECFSRAQKDMAEMMAKSVDRFEPLDNLQRLSAGVSMSSDIKRLVDSFLEYFQKQGGVLIVPIDDVDLNSAMAAEMLEQIRKYLIHPNILVLMSVKLDQLALTKRLRIAEEYRSLKDVPASLNDMFDGMVETYLTKTLPHYQRVYMPDGTVYFEKAVLIMDGDTEVEKFQSVRDMVPELIFRKTRYLFYNSAEKTSYIVPSNLRHLTMLVNLLYTMVDYWPKGKDIQEAAKRESNQYNKFTFRKYLYENWVPENLSQDMQNSVKELLDIQDVAQINAKVLSILKTYFKQLESDCFNDTDEQNECRLILEPSNKSYNIAIGDVLDLIDMLEESETQNIKLKFLFFLRSYYSIQLYTTYGSSIDEISNENANVHILLNNNFSHLHLQEYAKFVAGYFFNSDLCRIVPKEASNANRARRNICFNEFTRLKEAVINSGDVNDPCLPLVEFFMLGISRRHVTKSKDHVYKYRQNGPVFYAEPLHYLQKNAYFDIGAFLFNLTRIKDCYFRFKSGDKIFEMACNSEISLYNRFQRLAKQMGHDWSSWCRFRNAEVIRAFKAHMLSIESPGGDNVKVLVDAFRRMSKFKIQIYDKNECGEYESIDFQYFTVVAEMLSNLADSKDFLSIYNNPDPNNVVPEYIDTSVIMKTANEAKNLVRTRINKILQTYPVIATHYESLVRRILGVLGTYASRQDLVSAIDRLNRYLDRFRYKK